MLKSRKSSRIRSSFNIRNQLSRKAVVNWVEIGWKEIRRKEMRKKIEIEVV